LRKAEEESEDIALRTQHHRANAQHPADEGQGMGGHEPKSDDLNEQAKNEEGICEFCS
jgi:hypothetical protein